MNLNPSNNGVEYVSVYSDKDDSFSISNMTLIANSTSSFEIINGDHVTNGSNHTLTLGNGILLDTADGTSGAAGNNIKLATTSANGYTVDLGALTFSSTAGTANKNVGLYPVGNMAVDSINDPGGHDLALGQSSSTRFTYGGTATIGALSGSFQ